MLEINPFQWISVFLEWSSGVETKKEREASGDPEKPLTSSLAHKQESAVSVFFGQLHQPGAAVVYSRCPSNLGVVFVFTIIYEKKTDMLQLL